MPKVQFVVEHHAVEVSSGRSLREIALEAGIHPNREWFRGVNCGGRGLCGTCKVWVKPKAAGAVSEPNLREKVHGMGDGRRLACQTRVLGDIEVTTFPGGDDRTTAGRVIDPAPVRPEAEAEAAKPAASAKEATADKKPAKPSDGAATKPEANAEKKADAPAADAKAESEASTTAVKVDKKRDEPAKNDGNGASEGEATKAATEGKAEVAP